MSVLFTRNDYTLGIRCPRLLRKYRSEGDSHPAFSEWKLSKLSDAAAAQKYYSKTDSCVCIESEDINMAAAKTADALASGAGIIGGGAVIVRPLSVRFDMLRQKSDGTYTLSVIRAGTHLRQINCHDAAYQIFVLAAAGIEVSSVELVLLNPKWNGINTTPMFVTERITGRVFSLVSGVKIKLEKLICALTSKDEPCMDVHSGCFAPSECELWCECFDHLPENNVFDVGGMSRQTKMKLYRAGKTALEDAVHDKSLSPQLKNQISDALYKTEPFIDREKIASFLKTLHYPLCFLDFESIQLPIPPFDGMHPFEATAFQYSLHILYSSDEKPVHKSCIVPPGTDPRRIIAERLIADIPGGACIAAYNMQLERQIISSLAERFKDLREKLLEMYANTRDMMHPFLKKYYYAPKMNGSFSLKKVLRALYPDDEALDYRHLDGVHNGKEASCAYAMMTIGAGDCDADAVIRELDAYCALDTYALVKLHEKLCEAVKNNEAAII